MNSEEWNPVKLFQPIVCRKLKQTSKTVYCFIGVNAIVSSALYPLKTTNKDLVSLFDTLQMPLLFVNLTSILIRQDH